MSKEFIAGLQPDSTANLVLINSPLRDYGETPKADYDVLPPIGLAYIASEATSHGHNIGIIDAEHHGIGVNHLAELANNLNPENIGINILTPTRLQALKFAQQLNSEIPLLIGGPHATALPKKTIKEFSVKGC